MAGDWVKIRVYLAKDPKTIAVADHLARNRRFMDWLTDPVQVTCRESAYEHITSDVIVMITVASLVMIWGVARERGKEEGNDIVMEFSSAGTLDKMCGVPGMGDAMTCVGWVIEEHVGEPAFRLRFPNFLSDSSPYDKSKRAHAEAQRRYLQKKRALKGDDHSDITRDDHSDITMTTEKRREEKSIEEEEPPTPRKPRKATKRPESTSLPEVPAELNTPEFLAAWSDWLTHRAQIREKVTPLAASKALTKLAAMGPARAAAAIAHSIASGWKGVFEETRAGQPTQSPQATARAEEEARRTERLKAIPIPQKPMPAHRMPPSMRGSVIIEQQAAKDKFREDLY